MYQVSSIGYQVQNRRGFSLLEVIIVVAMAVGVLFVVASLRGNVGILQDIISQKLESRRDLDQTFQILVTEIRSAGPSSAGAYPIEAAGSSTFTFYSDIDKDDVFEKVRYFFATSTIKRGVIEPSGNPLIYVTSSEVMTTVIENIILSTSTSIFEYYDPAYTGLEASMTLPIDVTKVRVVKVSVLVDVAPGKAPKPTLFTNTITIRNLRSN